MLISELAQADVAILGVGREGLSARRALRRRYPRKTLSLYTESPAAEGVRARLDPALDRLIEGPLEQAALMRHDVVVRSPGISPYRPALAESRRRGLRFTSASSIWFAEHPWARTLCLTGTKGKSTTAALTAHLLSAAGASVQLAGNIGQPLLDCDDQDVDWWIIELSSYQLADLEARPSIGAILNLSDEHLDWHGGAARYRSDKLRLVQLLDGNPLAACATDSELPGLLEGVGGVHWFDAPGSFEAREGAVWLKDRSIVPCPPAALRGQHSLRNLAAALALLQLAGFDTTRAEPALGAFQGLPHRLQVLGENHGLTWVNDSLATTPVASMAALEAFTGQPVTMLVGGLDRGLDWRPAIERMAECPPWSIVALPDSGPALAAQMRAAGLAPPGGIHEARDLEAAVAVALRDTPPGGVVLLSPGAPSFPHFRDYADRGLQFARLAGLGSAVE